MADHPSSAPPRPLVVCADDFGLAAGVSAAIVELIADGRLSATSCMALLPDWRRSAARLRETVARRPTDVGLHLTLTDHAPLTAARRLAPGGRLPALGRLLPRALARALPAAELRDELRAQLDAFEEVWGAAPDYLDGHQHVHVLPVVRDVVVEEIARRYPSGGVWVRDCFETPRRCLRRGTAAPKALLISALGWRLHRLLAARGIPHNAGFSGLHDFSGRRPFGELMRTFLAATGPAPLVHVHPGRVDAELRACDTLTTPREAELAYLASERFSADLAAAGFYPARLRDCARSAHTAVPTKPPTASKGSST